MEPAAAPLPRLRRVPTALSGRLRGFDARAIDVAVAAALTVVALATLLGRDDGAGDFRSDDVLGAALVFAQTLPLAVRRVAPIGVLLAITAALTAHSAIGYEVVQAGTLGSLVAVYGATSLTDARKGLFAALVTASALLAFFATNRGEWSLADIAAISGTWTVAWIAGTWVRVRGEQVEVVGARADRLELEREALAHEAVADERARIARELHDIVGHALNVIVLQAAGAQRAFDIRPDVPRDALAAIESTGRAALFDMERMLGVLSAADGASGPQPGLAQLDALASQLASAGLRVEVNVEGAPVGVPASVDLSAYRIVQESLTNCLKHSGASAGTVTVRYQPGEVEVEVVDNGRGTPPHSDARLTGGGRGHLGMRERVAVFGGDITIGPLSSTGGYRVRARLPFESKPS